MASPVSFLVVFSLLFICVSAHDKHEGGYSYKGASGPESWGKLSPENTLCTSGKHQSPIDIVKSKTVFGKKLQPLIRRYHSANATLVNTGHSIAVHFEDSAGFVGIDGKNYTLKRMHWHSPSEHLIDGDRYPAELHLVHEAADGTKAVVGILYQLGAPDPLLAKFEDKLEELRNESCGSDEDAHIALGTVDPKQLKKKTRKYYRYSGSFTTPPCSENITWSILGKVRTISKEQVKALKAPLQDSFKNNSRPPQSLYDRQIQVYDELSEH